MSFLSPDDAGTPAQPKVEATPGMSTGPTTKKPKAQNQRSSFLGADATPSSSANTGGQTLLGT